MPKNLDIGDRVMIRQDREFCQEFSGTFGVVQAFDGEEWVLVQLDGAYEYPYLMLRAEDLMSEDEFHAVRLEEEEAGRLTCPDDRF